MNQEITLKGIDNVFFDVQNLKKATDFYQQLGFKKKLEIPQIKAVVFSIGSEEPGLILCEKQAPSPSRLWVEVGDIIHIKDLCHSKNIQGNILETATGLTFEIHDPSGNRIGFADYSKKPNLGRVPCTYVAEEYAHRVWDQHDFSAIDELLDPQVIVHSLLGDFYGREKMKNVVKAWLEAFPDLVVNNSFIQAQKDYVMIHWTAAGTHQGEFKGIKATNKPVSYAGVTLYRITQDKITEYWAYLDMHHLLQQIKT